MRYLTKLTIGIIFVMSAATASGQQMLDTSNQPQPLLRLAKTPAIYNVWWHFISACSHVKLPEDYADRTTWVLVPTRPFRTRINGVDDDAVILSDSTSRDVVIYVNYTGILDKGLITHEMQHAALFWKYGQKFVGQHPLPYYAQCGLIEKGQQKLND